MSELVTFGETMLRLSPPDGERIETARELAFRTAGAESNVAIAAARLGVDATWLSKLPDSALGRRVVHDVRSHGVRPRIVWTDDHRQGTYYIEAAGEPRGTNVIYDRADAAITTAEPSELAVDAVEGAAAFYTSGITPALSDTLRDTTTELLRRASEHDTRTVFDVNYRSKLWEPADAADACLDLFEYVDTLVVARRDVATLFGDRPSVDLPVEGSAEELTVALRETFDFDAVLLTRGSEGATGVTGETVVTQPAYEAETIDPIGTGDSFVGGYLAHRLDGGSFGAAMEYGAATAALKRTIEGDLAVVTPEEVQRVADSDERTIDR